MRANAGEERGGGKRAEVEPHQFPADQAIRYESICKPQLRRKTRDSSSVHAKADNDQRHGCFQAASPAKAGGRVRARFSIRADTCHLHLQIQSKQGLCVLAIRHLMVDVSLSLGIQRRADEINIDDDRLQFLRYRLRAEHRRHIKPSTNNRVTTLGLKTCFQPNCIRSISRHQLFPNHLAAVTDRVEPALELFKLYVIDSSALSTILRRGDLPSSKACRSCNLEETPCPKLQSIQSSQPILSSRQPAGTVSFISRQSILSPLLG